MTLPKLFYIEARSAVGYEDFTESPANSLFLTVTRSGTCGYLLETMR